ncbi:aminoacyl-tRNA hydrolase [Desulfovibrio sp. OttesenSCG-928-F20]|nr:aminoacyl-tRNA hydrolase [Desulfovibrio sp. OttesenSCG-928-F20]
MELGGLIVGLGNPGEQYRNTRHNLGFMVIEALLAHIREFAQTAGLSGRKDAWNLWRCPLLPGRRQEWLLAQPLTYMNNSGDAVQRVAAYYRIDIDDILVLHDELDLPLGRMKMKKGGGNAGHNGIRSIEQMLGSPDFYRLRLGVGKVPGLPGVSRVLGSFHPDEKQNLEKIIEAATHAVRLFADQGPVKAQQFCNGFRIETS